MTVIRNTLWGLEEIEETKVCSECKQEKPLNEFHIRNRTMNGNKVKIYYTKECKICRNKIGRDRIRILKDAPPKTPCEICGSTVDVVGDHDWDTGEFRGWLCDTHNTGLGKFKDSVEEMKKGLEYLERKKERTK